MLTTVFLFSVLGAGSIALPGGPPVGMDYFVYDGANRRLWVPAGNTGSVDVIDVATGKVTPLAGFPTAPSGGAGGRKMGPSSATVDHDKVWVGNRGDNKLCSFDSKTFEKRACVQLAAMPDGLTYVAATSELWATTPGDQSITIVDVKTKTPGAPFTMKMNGEPEGYVVDGTRGIFYTNLEDKNKTLAIDVKTRKVVSSWPTGCGTEGPRGLALDGTRRLLFVACADGAATLDLAHGARAVGRIKTGGGVDDIAYAAGPKLLYIPSGRDATLTIARVADAGALTVAATVPTAKGARNPVLDAEGTAYIADSAGGRLIVVKPPEISSQK